MIKSSADTPIVEGRFFWASLTLLCVLGALSLRLWYVQVYKGSHYRSESENNRIRRIEIPAARGVVMDRYGQTVLGNRPFYDLVYIPQYVRDKSKTFRILSQLLHIPVSVFEQRYKAGQGRPSFLPVLLKRNLSLHQVSIIESNKVFLPGVDISVVPRREYNPWSPPHMLGYLGEVTQDELREQRERQAAGEEVDNPYLPGDLIGKQGLELRWEKYLRGRRGHKLIQVDAFGRQSPWSDDQEWLPQSKAEKGADVVLTLDLELQKAVKDAFKGKNGAVVVLDPRSGQILAMISEPGFDPAMYQHGLSVETWNSLLAHPFTPLLDKTTGGAYPPGSVFKAIVALAAIEEKVVNSHTRFNCPGSFTLGNKVFHCHNRGGHGRVDLREALMKSCDVYFYLVGVELGVDRIAKYAFDLGMGQRLGVRLNLERPGLIPTREWKKRTYGGAPWTVGETPNISIGQGSLLFTPMQMASMISSIANGGKVFRPYLVDRVVDTLGREKAKQTPEILQSSQLVRPETFKLIRRYLRDTVMDKEGTGGRSRVEGQTVGGKTGSVQVVSLKKNRNQVDVSMKWKEHAMFVAFSPVENAEIAIAVVSENDKVGGGGASAAPVAGKILETYWHLKKQRQKTRLSMKTD